MTSLILASSSPRRRQLLAEAGFAFTVEAPDDDAESGVSDALGPHVYVAELARRKAENVAMRLTTAPSERVLLAADTVAECEGRILGKPADGEEAREMLGWLSGREHQVLTGVCLVSLVDPVAGSTPAPTVEVVTTQLRMAPLSDAWLEPFLASGGWQGKAGAFGYQDGLEFVEIVQGSESNVVGLPMERVTPLLAQRGCFPSSTNGS